ncbi:MAG: NAD-dependent epimerase/dehydratase family protein [Proteobacteria bacterium]|nr:NAD-dependent epimerase/dehydratase family protein [Pseudomonadota bacterium]
MKVVITGGAGFIGLNLARALIGRGVLTGPSGAEEEIDSIVLFDAVPAPALPPDPDGRITTVTGDITGRQAVAAVIDRDDISVFHLASVVSGGGELDFDLAMAVNLDGARHVLEACRARAGAVRVVFASSIAVFGGAVMPETVGDATKRTPQTTYGVTKAIGELMINDYSRKGFIDGRSARLPTIIIRPGKPNQAASSFASGLFREPLNGEASALPVDPATFMPVLGTRSCVKGLIALHEADGAALGDDRAVGLPAINCTVADMIEALRRVADAKGIELGPITHRPDPGIEKIVATWPLRIDAGRALALGLPVDESLDRIVEDYIEDFLVP